MPPGAQPDWKSPTFEGTAPSWIRDIGDVTIACEDTIEAGKWVRQLAVIGIIEAVHGLDAAGARRLAAELNAAADLLDDDD